METEVLDYLIANFNLEILNKAIQTDNKITVFLLNAEKVGIEILKC